MLSYHCIHEKPKAVHPAHSPAEIPQPVFGGPPRILQLHPGEIHVWHAFLNQPESQLMTFRETLSIDEKTKAERFHFESDRNRFVLGRGILRAILGCYLGVEPYQVQFCYGSNGKPALADTFGKATIHFNLSHSEGLALCACARNHAIGVDIERVHDIPEMDHIAKRFFSARENTIFQALPKNKKKEAFFKCWTSKEAFIKATGDGLSRPLDTFDVSPDPNKPAEPLRVEGDSKGPSRWTIQVLKPASRFAAAFAVEGQIRPFCCWQYSDWFPMEMFV